MSDDLRPDDEIWADWQYCLERLCIELSTLRRKTGKQLRRFNEETNIDYRNLRELKQRASTILALTEKMEILYDEIEPEEQSA